MPSVVRNKAIYSGSNDPTLSQSTVRLNSDCSTAVQCGRSPPLRSLVDACNRYAKVCQLYPASSPPGILNLHTHIVATEAAIVAAESAHTAPLMPPGARLAHQQALLGGGSKQGKMGEKSGPAGSPVGGGRHRGRNTKIREGGPGWREARQDSPCASPPSHLHPPAAMQTHHPRDRTAVAHPVPLPEEKQQC